MTISSLLLILGVAVLSAALRTCSHPIPRKAGAVGVLATSFLVGWLLTDRWWFGVLLASTWFLLPWLEILTRVRRMRLPMERSLRPRMPPSQEVFPALEDLTDEVEEDGFAHVQDAGWDWEDHQQFFRLLYKESERCQAAVCMIEQNEIAFFYIGMSSRGKDGNIWTTWNYPFSYSLKFVPQLRLNRVRAEDSFHELYLSHCEFLVRNGIKAEDLENLDAEQMQSEIQKDMRQQIAHNLASGVLKRTDEGQIRYSWRGLFFIWIQFVRDLVRLS